MMVERNDIDGLHSRQPLLNWTELGSPVVLRVIEGDAGDDWIRAQAPTRPHNRSMWVRGDDFHFARTSRRIEIDLADDGWLTVYDGETVLLESGIVQGRDSRATPVHLTYLEAGVLGRDFAGPAYGYAVLSMASFSESLGTFGAGSSPKNYLHGTNAPDLMGQRVSSGEIRLPNGVIAELITLVQPGAPILIYDSSALRLGRSQILQAPIRAVDTVPFTDENLGISPAIERALPEIWSADLRYPFIAPADAGYAEAPNPGREPTYDYRFATARHLERARQIPVHEHPDGTRRTLLDINVIDGIEQPYPLFARTSFDQPLVLRVVDDAFDGAWLKVQVPVRPNGSTAWVRAEHFVVDSTSIRVEINLASTSASPAGLLRVYDGGEQPVFTTAIASGRESRPTPLGTGWVGQIVAGAELGPAYGHWVIDLGLHSETLGTFNAGGQPRAVLHGTNQPDLIGQRVSSGSARLSDAALDYLAQLDGIIGAPVTIIDRPIHQMNPLLETAPAISTQPATTTVWLPDPEPVTVAAL